MGVYIIFRLPYRHEVSCHHVADQNPKHIPLIYSIAKKSGNWPFFTWPASEWKSPCPASLVVVDGEIRRNIARRLGDLAPPLPRRVEEGLMAQPTLAAQGVLHIVHHVALAEGTDLGATSRQGSKFLGNLGEIRFMMVYVYIDIMI